MRYWRIVGLLCVVFLLSSCTSLVDRDQPQVISEHDLLLEPGHSSGQTFVAQHGGLQGVEFLITPHSLATGTLRFHLRAEPGAEHDIATAVISLDPVEAAGFHRFTFEPLRDSHGRYYYAFFTFEGTGAVHISRGPGDAYLYGALYHNHVPQDAQAVFRLAYAPFWTVMDVGNAVVRGVGLLGFAFLLYVVPGWALLAWGWPKATLTWPEQLALSVGLSVALYPLLLLWTNVIGVQLGALYAGVPVLAGVIALLWRYRDWRPRQGLASLRCWQRSRVFWPDMTFVVALGLIFGVRLLVVRTLDAPMWGDSYQHSMIVQLLVDNGGLFNSWAPYEPYHTLTVHVGFHTVVAVFAWLTGMTSIPATLWAAQLLNGCAALTLYPLAVRVARGRRWAGVGAVIAAGLISSMPAYYVNWGRYAQLTGQIILPVVIWLFWEAVENAKANKIAVILGGVTLAGMTLSYYRMPFYFLACVGPWFLLWIGRNWKVARSMWAGIFLRCILFGALALLLFIPWFGALSGSNLAVGLEKGLSATTSWDMLRGEYFLWYDLFTYVPPVLVLGVVVALVWALKLRYWEPLSIGLWLVVLSGLPAARLINLPGANYMQNFAVFIAFYIPVGVLFGWLIGQLEGMFSERKLVLAAVVLPVIMLWASVNGAWKQVSIVDSQFVMVTRPDTRAMDWIRDHTPAEARFLVEGFRIYNGRSIVGADAGWWLPLYTQRSNTMPPQYALFNEQPEPLDYSRRMVELVAALEETVPASPQGIALLCEEHITHVYIGQGQGLVGAGVSQLFAPQDFLDQPEFDLVYHEDRVYIFTLNDDLCINP